MDRVSIAEIRQVGSLRVGIPLAGEYAFPANLVECKPEPADPGKQVNKPEGAISGLLYSWQEKFELIGQRSVCGGGCFPDFPATDSSRVFACECCKAGAAVDVYKTIYQGFKLCWRHQVIFLLRREFFVHDAL
jgi:hypothetical protein